MVLERPCVPIFWKSEAKHQKLFKSKFGYKKLLRKWFWSYLDLKNECSERLKKAFFRLFAIFWVTKSKPFSWKVRQNIKNCLDQNLVIGSFLENGFEATLTSKSNVLSVWKEHFSVFCKFLSDVVETVSWESKTEPSRSFKLKVGHRRFFRKWFWSYLELKNEWSERLKRAFFSFLQIFDWGSWNYFRRKWGKTSETF